MPDFLTHLAAARIPGAFLRDPRTQAFLIFGTFVPDLVTKGGRHTFNAPTNFFHPAHSILGLFVLCYVLALFVETGIRRRAFAAIYGGGLLHVLVDLIKDHQGMGAARLFYPFSMKGYELGWIASENVVYLMPFDLLVLLGLLVAERRWKRVRK